MLTAEETELGTGGAMRSGLKTAAEAVRHRDRDIRAMRSAGVPVPAIAKYFRLAESHVYRLLAAAGDPGEEVPAMTSGDLCVVEAVVALVRKQGERLRRVEDDMAAILEHLGNSAIESISVRRAILGLADRAGVTPKGASVDA